MKQYDVRCPKCGIVNKGLFLWETGGRMECIGCGELSRCRIRYCAARHAETRAARHALFSGPTPPAKQGA